MPPPNRAIPCICKKAPAKQKQQPPPNGNAFVVRVLLSTFAAPYLPFRPPTPPHPSSFALAPATGTKKSAGDSSLSLTCCPFSPLPLPSLSRFVDDPIPSSTPPNSLFCPQPSHSHPHSSRQTLITKGGLVRFVGRLVPLDLSSSTKSITPTRPPSTSGRRHLRIFFHPSGGDSIFRPFANLVCCVCVVVSTQRSLG